MTVAFQGDGVLQLEPGDGTHYALLLTPCDRPRIAPFLGRWGIPLDDAADWYHVAKLGEGHGFVAANREVGPYDFEELARNDWSRVFFAWWFNELRAARSTVASYYERVADAR